MTNGHLGHLLNLFQRYYGPTMNAFAAAKKNGQEGELHHQLVEPAFVRNQSKNGSTNIPATFLRVTVSV